MQANLANDDGGGIRLPMVDGKRRSQTGDTGNAARRLFDDRINILNNTIANNISTHEGGGIALDDSTNVVIANNTVAHNTTTATAITSNGEPMPAGLSTTANSFLLQAELDKRYGVNARPLFSKPTLFNNLFTDNRAGSWSAATGLDGVGQTGDPGPLRLWDIGVAEGFCTGNNTRRCLTPVRNRLDTAALNSSQRDRRSRPTCRHRGELHGRQLPRLGRRPALARIPEFVGCSADRRRSAPRPDRRLPPRRRPERPVDNGTERIGRRRSHGQRPPPTIDIESVSPRRERIRHRLRRAPVGRRHDQRQQPNATRTTTMRDTTLSRRRLLTLGGATLAAGTLGGAAYGASPGRLLQSVGPPQAPARNVVHLAGTDGWVAIPAPAAPAGL